MPFSWSYEIQHTCLEYLYKTTMIDLFYHHTCCTKSAILSVSIFILSSFNEFKLLLNYKKKLSAIRLSVKKIFFLYTKFYSTEWSDNPFTYHFKKFKGHNQVNSYSHSPENYLMPASGAHGEFSSPHQILILAEIAESHLRIPSFPSLNFCYI